MASKSMDYECSRSAAHADTVVEFLQRNIFEEDLESIPGVGPACADVLHKNEMETPVQVLAKFLSFATSDRTQEDMCQAFYEYLKSLNIRGNVHTIVFSISSLADHKGLVEED